MVNPAGLQKSEATTVPVKALSIEDKINPGSQGWIFTGVDSQKQRPPILVQSAGIGLELTVEALPQAGLDQQAALQLKDLKPRLERSAGPPGSDKSAAIETIRQLRNSPKVPALPDGGNESLPRLYVW